LASAVLGFSWSASTARMLKSALRRLRKGLKGARCDSSVLCLTPTLPQHPTSLRDCARLPFHVLGTTRRRSRIAPWSVPESVTSENCCNRTARITKCKTQNVDSCRFPMIELAGLHERLRERAERRSTSLANPRSILEQKHTGDRHRAGARTPFRHDKSEICLLTLYFSRHHASYTREPANDRVIAPIQLDLIESREINVDCFQTADRFHGAPALTDCKTVVRDEP